MLKKLQGAIIAFLLTLGVVLGAVAVTSSVSASADPAPASAAVAPAAKALKRGCALLTTGCRYMLHTNNYYGTGTGMVKIKCGGQATVYELWGGWNSKDNCPGSQSVTAVKNPMYHYFNCYDQAVGGWTYFGHADGTWQNLAAVPTNTTKSYTCYQVDLKGDPAPWGLFPRVAVPKV